MQKLENHKHYCYFKMQIRRKYYSFLSQKSLCPSRLHTATYSEKEKMCQIKD